MPQVESLELSLHRFQHSFVTSRLELTTPLILSVERKHQHSKPQPAAASLVVCLLKSEVHLLGGGGTKRASMALRLFRYCS